MEKSVPISSNTFWGTPFLEKLQKEALLTLIGQFLQQTVCRTLEGLCINDI